MATANDQSLNENSKDQAYKAKVTRETSLQDSLETFTRGWF
jgi:hypothetical protein